MFRLSDVVAAADPVRGGETGESFLEYYLMVLNQIDVRGFEQKTADDRKRYEKAISYLSQSGPDPEDITQNVTKLELYTRLQKK